MGEYKYKYSAILALKLQSAQISTQIMNTLNLIEKAAKAIATSNDIKGDTAGSIKSYYAEMYDYIINALRAAVTLQQYDINRYLTAAVQDKLNGNTVADTAQLKKIVQSIKNNESAMSDAHQNEQTVKNNVSDLVDVPSSDYAKVQQIKNELITHIDKTISNISELENMYLSPDTMLTDVSTIISRCRAITPSLYTPFSDMDQFIERYESLQGYGTPVTIERTIREFEEENADIRNKFNRFLNSGKMGMLSREEKDLLKYKAYTAREPYRTLYLNNLDKFRFKDSIFSSEASYFRTSILSAFHITKDKGIINIERKGRIGEFLIKTICHECGHAIDFSADKTNDSGHDIDNFTFKAKGKEYTLQSAIRYDVFYNRDNPHSVSSIAYTLKQQGSAGNPENVVNAYINNGYADLNKQDKVLYNAVKSDFQKNISESSRMETVVDVYGGMTKNALIKDAKNEYIIGYYHPDEYWNNPLRSNRPAYEYWAEHFDNSLRMMPERTTSAYHATNVEYFPTASQGAEAYAQYKMDVQPSEPLNVEVVDGSQPKG